MLFVLDESLAENIDDRKVQQALEYIGLGRSEGKHLVFCEKMGIMKTFAECEALSQKTRAVYFNIYNKLASKRAYYNTFVRYMRVVAEGTHSGISWRDVGNKKEIRISANLIDDSTFIQKTMLLCENETDCRLYEKMARMAVIGRKINISYEPRGGGGAETGKVYRVLQKGRNRLCLCIADSDQKYPGGPIGDTARNIRKADKPSETLCELKIIDVREAENLIPTSMFSEVSEKDQNRMSAVDFLECLEKSSNGETRKFLDLKEGLNGYRFFGLLSKNQPPDYWQNFFNIVRPFRANIKEECIYSQDCSASDDKRCECFVMQGLGDGILEDVLNMLDHARKGKTDRKIAEMIPDELRDYWEEYGELTAACCSGSPIL